MESNQIQFSLDTFLKKSDSCGFFKVTRRRRRCPPQAGRARLKPRHPQRRSTSFRPATARRPRLGAESLGPRRPMIGLPGSPRALPSRGRLRRLLKGQEAGPRPHGARLVWRGSTPARRSPSKCSWVLSFSFGFLPVSSPDRSPRLTPATQRPRSAAGSAGSARLRT